MAVGIWVIGDLYKDGEIIEFDYWHSRGIARKYYLNWMSLISSIPKNIKFYLKKLLEI